MGRASPKWTADSVPALTGRTIVITGGNSGIGFEAARVCVARGAETVLACRSSDKAEAAAHALRDAHPGVKVAVEVLDLASLASVRACAARLRESFPRIDALVNNAGIMMTPYQTTADGFESQMGVNHLGHFALTGLLLPSLLAAPAARVVNVSSLAHSFGRMDWNNPLYEGGRGYDSRLAYGRSKLANLLFTRGLAQRLSAVGVNVLSLAAHPGIAQTNLMHNLERQYRLVGPFMRAIGNRFLQSAGKGALPTLRAMVDPDARGGDFYGPDGFRQQWGYPVKVGSTPASRDPQDIERLWELSERLTGVRYELSETTRSRMQA